MRRTPPRYVIGLLLSLVMGWSLLAADRAAAPSVSGSRNGATLSALSDFRTVETAITTHVSRAEAGHVSHPGYLGVHVSAETSGKLIIAQVAENSPAARGGLQPGDMLLRLGGHEVHNSDALRDQLQARSAGEEIPVTVVRAGKTLEKTVTLVATSRPMKLGSQRAGLGVQLGQSRDRSAVPVERVPADSPAAKAGLKDRDLLLKIDGLPLTGSARLGDALAEKKPGDTVMLTIRRQGKEQEIRVELVADRGQEGRIGGWDTRTPSYWKKSHYRLAVIGIEYPDVKHNPKITVGDWVEALFSHNSYDKKNNVTGQPVYGTFHLEGKIFDWVEVGKKRGEYSQGTGTSNKTALLVEALDRLRQRDGKDALDNFDGLFFIYAGERFRTTRGGLYWPHRSSLSHHGKRWSYFICPEGGPRMSNISVICHEFGHMLGLPDLYARPENPGSEGVGLWCAMSQQIGNGRPQHFCAWSKEKLGWLKPAVLDPTTKQKLILAPVEDSARECFKVLIRPDGSEYLLLENRRKQGFDQQLPAEGLLIWHVVNNKPLLEESHGVEGPAGPRVFLGSIPYPSAANDAFTPYTTPSSRSQLGGGLPVHITNIRRLPDGRITFYMGYEFL